MQLVGGDGHLAGRDAVGGESVEGGEGGEIPEVVAQVGDHVAPGAQRQHGRALVDGERRVQLHGPLGRPDLETGLPPHPIGPREHGVLGLGRLPVVHRQRQALGLHPHAVGQLGTVGAGAGDDPAPAVCVVVVLLDATDPGLEPVEAGEVDPGADVLDQERARASADDGDATEPPGEALEQLDRTGHGSGRGRVGDDRGEGAVEVEEQRRARRVRADDRAELLLGATAGEGAIGGGRHVPTVALLLCHTRPVATPRLVRRTVAASAVVLALAGCDEHTVAVRFEPEVGDVYRFEADVETQVLRTVDGVTTDESDAATLDATQTVQAVADDEVLVRIALRRDDAAPRTVDVRLDRASRLTAIDLVEGVPAEALGLDVGMDLPADIGSPPTGRLEPGDRWEILREVSLGDLARPILVQGRGRIDSLGVEDGRKVAVAVVELDVPVRTILDTADGRVRLVGTQHTTSETAYDLADGALRRDRTVTDGRVEVIAEPPAGVDAEPLRGDIEYRIVTRTRRLGASTPGSG